MVYEKLVRDLIPDLIAAQGEKPNIRILDDAEYRDCLSRKLDEEVQEFHKENNLEELADILEVVYALAGINGGRKELERIYAKKHEERGGFAKRIYLISKE
jgi:predicted house-cleaning noncanonical NTP pyrophosphatase (MazG superfamily)